MIVWQSPWCMCKKSYPVSITLTRPTGPTKNGSLEILWMDMGQQNCIEKSSSLSFRSRMAPGQKHVTLRQESLRCLLGKEYFGLGSVQDQPQIFQAISWNRQWKIRETHYPPEFFPTVPSRWEYSGSPQLGYLKSEIESSLEPAPWWTPKVQRRGQIKEPHHCAHTGVMEIWVCVSKHPLFPIRPESPQVVLMQRGINCFQCLIREFWDMNVSI